LVPSIVIAVVLDASRCTPVKAPTGRAPVVMATKTAVAAVTVVSHGMRIFMTARPYSVVPFSRHRTPVQPGVTLSPVASLLASPSARTPVGKPPPPCRIPGLAKVVVTPGDQVAAAGVSGDGLGGEEVTPASLVTPAWPVKWPPAPAGAGTPTVVPAIDPSAAGPAEKQRSAPVRAHVRIGPRPAIPGPPEHERLTQQSSVDRPAREVAPECARVPACPQRVTAGESPGRTHDAAPFRMRSLPLPGVPRRGTSAGPTRYNKMTMRLTRVNN
jgi:hypothetical protein